MIDSAHSSYYIDLCKLRSLWRAPMIRRNRQAANSAKAPRGIVSSLWRHKGKGTLWFIVVVAATAAVILYWPRSYRSEAMLFVRLGRESVSLDPTATMGQTIAVSESRENEINSI